MSNPRKKQEKNLNIEKMNISFALCVGCGLIHLVYLIIYLIMGINELIMFNIFSIMFYAIVAFICTRKPSMLLLVLIEIIAFTFYSEIILGDGCGFQLIFISIVPAAFYVIYLNKIKTIITSYIVAGSFISFILLTVLNKFGVVTPKVEISSINALVISLVNSIMVFAVIITTSMIFIKKIKQKETGLENQNERLSRLANVDPLTELLNRRSINQKLELSMQRKINLNVDFTVAIADIDNFKDLNDTRGHDCGDKVLKNIAEEIKRAVRDSDYVCRWGGEEILILFCGSGQEASGRVLERIRKNIEENGGMYQGSRIDVTMTFGVSSSEKYSSVKDIILKADENLYHGKKSGKNCIVYS